MQSAISDNLIAAAAARKSIYATDTDAVRLVDGPADGFPAGAAIDDFAGRWLLQTRDAALPEWARQLHAPIALYWKKLDGKAAPEWIAGEKAQEPFTIRENGLHYWIDFTAGYSQGLFPDQRTNRAALRSLAPGKSLLNCFAYTCSFGVAAAAAGASTLNIDLSRASLAWGKRNYELNAIHPNSHEFLHGDVFDWFKRLQKRGRHFDFIVLDPPTFSRDNRGKVFTVEARMPELVQAAAALLAPRGRILCSTNQRSLNAAAFRQLILSGLPRHERWKLHAASMPPDFKGEQYLKSLWAELLG